MTVRQNVPDSDFPQLFQAADAASARGQAAYVNGSRGRLTLIVAAAALGVVSWRVGDSKIDLLALAGFVGFIAALITELWLWKGRPDRDWYDGRAVAESAKTLAWKFAVCAKPFPADMSASAARQGLAARLDRVRSQFDGLQLDPVDAPTISEWMDQQRGSSLDDRRSTYLVARIADQKGWYSRKAKYNRRRSNQWRSALASLEVLAAVLSLIEVFVDTGLLLAPAVAAGVGAVAAWLETKQHDSLARAYAAAVADLSSAEVKLNEAGSEEAWAAEVDDAEEAISREHVVWRASRSRL